MIRTVFIIVVVIHGLIHLMGFAKAFGYAELPQLAQPISRTMGALWLIAVVAASLGHERVSTTVQSYARPEAVAGAQQRRALRVLGGGAS